LADLHSNIKELNEKLNKKLAMQMSLEEELDKERNLRGALEKQLAQVNKNYESQNLLIQDNKSSQAERQQAITDLQGKISHLMIDLERKEEELRKVGEESEEIKQSLK